MSDRIAWGIASALGNIGLPTPRAHLQRKAGRARTGAEALRLVGELRPDVVLLDPELSDSDGIAIAELMRRELRAEGDT